MTKRFVFAVAAMLSIMVAQAQTESHIDIYGFVRSYLNFDSRRTFTVLGGEYNMLPYDHQWNSDGSDDLNAVPHLQLQALTSRLGVRAVGPAVLGMESEAVLEGDFGGFGSNNSILRLRLAYVQLSRGDSLRLRIGQDWHPMSGEIMPEVLGMAAGAPFRPHSRTPQVRADYYVGSIGVTASVLSQLQFANNGPRSAADATSVASTDYAYNALWPEGFIGLNYRAGGWYAQLGVDAQVLRPRTSAIDASGVEHRVVERVGSISPTLYAQYTSGLLALKGRTLIASNTSHLNQLVGYGVVGVDADGVQTYAPIHAAVSYVNIAYGKRWRANLFLGYMKNLGAAVDLHDYGYGTYRVYMKGGEDFTHLNSLWRVSPSVCWNAKTISIGMEYELTAATFGDINANGSIALNDNLHQVVNHRLCCMVKYNF